MQITIAVSAIALLLVLILAGKVHPFIALILVSILTALAAGIAPVQLVSLIEEGMGKTLGHIGLIIPLGAMIGRMIDKSGGAASFATRLVQRLGLRRAPAALSFAGFIIGIPVFFEVGVIMLIPMAQSMSRTTGMALPQVALPLCITLLVVHALLPPHPGAVAAAGLLQADVGRILLWGLPIAALTAVVAFHFAKLLARRVLFNQSVAEPVAPALESIDEGAIAPACSPAGLGTAAFLVLLPIVLIMLGTLARTALAADSLLYDVLVTLGTPFVALLLDVLLCAYILGIRRGASRIAISDVMAAAIPGIAGIILITGAGGVFANVLVATGIGRTIADLIGATGLPIVGIAFVLTLLLRAAQGPTTVALITTAGILSPAVTQAALTPNHLALTCLAMGAGGLAVSHVNDAGFWIVTRLIGLTVAQGLRTWTLITTGAGLTGFLIIILLWRFV